MLELDRSVGFIDLVEQQALPEQKQRGICFDETHKSFMTNQDLKYALNQIQHTILGGKKIAVVWFDACLMSMIEIADICKDHAQYLVASEDVEYASGSNYQLVLSPMLNNILSPQEFACHIVASFEKAYQPITRDFTQSAINLSKINALETNINIVAQQLLLAMQNQKNKSVIKMLQQCKTRPCCTCFEEPTFIDLQHFYINLQANLWQISLVNQSLENVIKASLSTLLKNGIEAIDQAVIANAAGSNIAGASGLSIYFPERRMFHSYLHCPFARSNSWCAMIQQYLMLV
jgi:hypothetical protein